MKLIQNKWKTPDGTILHTKHRYDYIKYKDKNGEIYTLDGGSDYIIISKNKQKLKNLCIYSDGKFENDRCLLWGKNYGKNGKKLKQTKWIKVKDLETEHIYKILETQILTKFWIRLFWDELRYREELILNENN